MIHRREGFRLNLEDGVPIFRRCDGTVLESPIPRDASPADACERMVLRRTG
jgi:hypothetical protein